VNYLRHSGAREARTRNLEIPGSLVPLAPRNDVHFIFIAALNLAASSRDQPRGLSRTSTGENKPMKIALVVLLGLVLGALGGAALGIGAGLAWVEIFRTTSFEGYSGMLVFFTFMPLGAAIGGLGGALLFGVIAIRDTEIAIEREPARRRDR
jgi:hypothetical protein